MGNLSSLLNPFDFIIVVTLLAGIGLGFIRGLVRMVLNLVVLYISVVLAMTLYVPVGSWINYLSMGALPQTTNQALAFVILLVLTTSVLNFVLRRTYKDTQLPGVRHIDQLGGMIVGTIVTSVWIGLILVALAFVMETTSSQSVGNTIQANLYYYYSSSALVSMFYRFLPIVIATLKPWMPKGLTPDILTLKLF